MTGTNLGALGLLRRNIVALTGLLTVVEDSHQLWFQKKRCSQQPLWADRSLGESWHGSNLSL